MDLNWLNKFSLILDEHKREFRTLLFAVPLGGLILAARSIRPFQKFKHVGQIPSSFVERKIKLNGAVLGIEVNSVVLLRVDHNPIFGSRIRRKSNPGLGVSISSINITGNGISWLQHMLVHQNIDFLLLKKEPDRVSCIVYFKGKNVAEELLKIGFATVDSIDFDLESDKLYLKYYKSLLKLENKAEKKRLGVWSDTKQTFLDRVMGRIGTAMIDLFYKFRR